MNEEENADFEPMEFGGVIATLSQTVTSYQNELDKLSKIHTDLNDILHGFEALHFLAINDATQDTVKEDTIYRLNEINAKISQIRYQEQLDEYELFVNFSNAKHLIERLSSHINNIQSDIEKGRFAWNESADRVKLHESTLLQLQQLIQFTGSIIWAQLDETVFFKLNRANLYEEMKKTGQDFSDELLQQKIDEQLQQQNEQLLQTKISNYLIEEKSKLNQLLHTMSVQTNDLNKKREDFEQEFQKIKDLTAQAQSMVSTHSTNLYGKQFLLQYEKASIAFSINCLDLKISKLFLWILFIVSTAGGALYYFIDSIDIASELYKVSQINTASLVTQNANIETNKLVWLRLSVLPVGMLLAWFGINQYNKQKYIIEEYAHKKTLALSISVFRDGLQNEEPALKESYYRNLFDALGTSPLQSYMQKNQNSESEQMVNLAREILVAQMGKGAVTKEADKP